MMVLDTKSIADAMVCACTTLLRDLSEYDLIQCIGHTRCHQSE